MSTKYKLTKFACYVGYIVQAVVNNFLPILFIAFNEIYDLTYEKLGRLIFFNFATQIFTDYISPKIIDFLGYKRTALLSQATASLGLAMLGILPSIFNNPYFLIILSIIIYAFGSGLMEVILSPMMEMMPSKNKSGNMQLLHSFYCWGQAITILITTFLVFAFGYTDWQYIPIIWAILPLLNVFLFIKCKVIEPDKEEKKSTFKELFSNRKFRCYMIMMICAGASEIAMAEWASMFVQQSLGLSKVVGDLAGPCAFAILMGTGRVWYATVSKKLNFYKTLIVLSSLCFVCYITVAFCKVSIISLIFCALCGFTVGISWPGIYSSGAKEFPNGSSVMYSVFALCGDTGCCMGPWILGIIADRFNLNIGFAVASVFPIMMVLTVLYLLKNRD